MYLFFDTETTGFPDKKLPIDDERQPKLLQIAAILADENLEIRGLQSCYIKHEGYTIDEEGEAFKVNGITQEHMERYGVTLDEALMTFGSLYVKSPRIVAHNIGFDTSILECNGFVFSHADHVEICTQKMASDMGANGRLTDMYRHFTGKELQKAHTAIADAKACYDIFKIMKGM